MKHHPLCSFTNQPFILIEPYKKPHLTLTIGEPLFADKSLSRTKQIEDLTIRAHQQVCRLASINPEENIYPPLFENNKRVDYYPNPNAVPLED